MSALWCDYIYPCLLYTSYTDDRGKYSLQVAPGKHTFLSHLDARCTVHQVVEVREEGGVGSDFDLSINGLSGNSIRYFLDGMPLDTKGSGVSLANLPLSLIHICG